MGRRAGFALLLLLFPLLARAEEAPEQLLPATTQGYIRWDGIDAHRAAYEKSALGRMMQGDTGAFINDLYGQLQDGLSALLTVDQLLGGVAPDKLAKMQADANGPPNCSRSSPKTASSWPARCATSRGRTGKRR